MRSCVLGGSTEAERESIFLPPGFFKLLCFFFQRGDRLHHPGGEDTIWGMYFVSLLAKDHIEIFCLKRLTTLVLFLIYIYYLLINTTPYVVSLRLACRERERETYPLFVHTFLPQSHLSHKIKHNKSCMHTRRKREDSF